MNRGGQTPQFSERMCSEKTPIFNPFFLKIPGIFSVSDKSILTSEMDVINYPEHNHIFIFSKTFSKKTR